MPLNDVQIVPFGLERGFSELGDDLWIVMFAAKNIQVCGIRPVGKVGGNEGGLNELRH